MSEPTIFTRIIEGEIPADVIYEDDHCIAIRDINPQAPVHVLVIPREPIPKLSEADAEHRELLGHLMLAVRRVADQEGIGDAFRMVMNNGSGAGQTVFHLHLHVLGGLTFDEGRLAQ